MGKFNNDLGGTGVPVTLSSLSGRYLKNTWSLLKYKGYQISPKFLLGDASSSQTPRGLFALNQLGLKLGMYIGNFKGGRNEMFMYGSDDDTVWYDYDLVSAYTTVMALMGDPDYTRQKTLSESELNSMKKLEILYSYLIINCKFKFPDTVKYPSIGCFVKEEDTSVYPLKGSALITGSEYLLAQSQGCEFEILEVNYIPFKKDGVNPFKDCISEIQRLRSLNPKGSVLNILYKEIGNSLYGLTARGISSKKRFDLKQGKSVKMDVNDFANPLICSWITAFIRSVIGELLHYISTKNRMVVSVTTDGFVTDYPNLIAELDLNINKGFSLYAEYCKIRKELSGNGIGLEEKGSGAGIVS